MNTNRILVWIAYAAIVAFSNSVDAQSQPIPPFTIQILPSNPTASDNTTATIGVDRCYALTVNTTNQGGNVLRIDIAPAICPGTPFGPVSATLGQLPFGVYTVNVFYGGTPAGSTTFSVTAFALTGVPALSDVGLILLFSFIAVLGFRKMRSRNIVSIWLVIPLGLFGWSATTSSMANAATAEVPTKTSVVSKRVKIRFDRTLLDPSASDLQVATDRPGRSALSTNLGSPAIPFLPRRSCATTAITMAIRTSAISDRVGIGVDALAATCMAAEASCRPNGSRNITV